MRNAIQEDISLARLTTFGIGGPARFFVEASTEDELIEAIDFARSDSMPFMILGGGSNLLVADAGFSGLVIRVAIDGITWEDGDRHVAVRAGAGCDWDRFVADCVERGLYGLECLSGIPGRVGGTPVQNVGAYGQEVSDVISRVRVYDLDENAVQDLPAAECQFAYRSSVFNSTAHGRYVVLAVEYRLRRNGEPDISYPDLARVFKDASVTDLKDVRDAVLRVRLGKAMLLVEGDPDCRSAGSFFRNPLLSTDQLADVETRAANAGCDNVPRYDTRNGSKVPAAWLVEQSGFPKGTVRGPVGLSTRHALAVINRGGATAADVVEFAGEIQRGVEARFGVRLKTEPAFVGFPDDVVRRFGAVVG